MSDQEIDWTTSRLELDYIGKIADRVEREIKQQYPRQKLVMDLIATHKNGCELNLPKLLGATGFDFKHDIIGIHNHLDRRCGKLMDCFVPRCAYHDSKGLIDVIKVRS